MMNCDQVQELIPWYVTGRIDLEDAREIALHMASCSECQADFAEAAWMRRLVAGHANEASARHEKSWRRIEKRVGIADLARIDVGSFMIGLKLGITTATRRYPVRGTLRVMGHNVRIAGGKRRKKEAGRVQE